MFTVLQNIIHFFFEYTSILDKFAYLENYSGVILTVIFASAIVLGFFVYRLYFSVIIFYVLTTVFIWLLSPVTSWQNTAACIAVVAVIISLLSFRWTHFAAILTCLVMGGLFGWLVYPAVVAAVVGGLVCGALSVFFPLYSICVFLPIFGALGIYEIYSLPIWAVILVILAGIAIQLLVSRKQALFARNYPAKIDYWLDQIKLKRKNKHAAGV